MDKICQSVEKIDMWPVQDLSKNIENKNLYILDVREKNKIDKQGFIENSHNVYVGEVPIKLKSIPKNKQILVYCDTGFKTSIASSILKMHSYPKVTNLLGGFTAWKNAGF